MVDIRPFAGLRPPQALANEVAAPPYDVLDRGEARAYVQRHPNSFLRVTRSDALLDESVDPHGAQALQRARTELDKLLADGLLVPDDAPHLYVYEQTMGAHVQVGLVAGVSAAEYRDGLIKRHEKTRVVDLDDRRRHIEATDANTGLVFLTYRGDTGIDELIADITAAAPSADFVAEDGIGHRLWVVADAGQQRALIERFSGVPALYVADGHHRTHASFQIWEQRVDTAAGEPGSRPIDHFMAVLFAASQLQILAYNRVIADLAGHTPDSFLAAVGESFTVEPTDTPDAPHRRAFGMYVGGKWWRIAPRAHIVAKLPPDGDPDGVDVAVLQNFLLAPILGIGDPRTDERIRFVGGIRGTAELSRRVDDGAGVAFTVFATAIEQVMAVADRGEVMPPKSTWFEPKLRSGLVVRRLL